MRWKESPSERASACASEVLPTPGTSSMSTWPPASEAHHGEADHLGLAAQHAADVVLQPADGARGGEGVVEGGGRDGGARHRRDRHEILTDAEQRSSH